FQSHSAKTANGFIGGLARRGPCISQLRFTSKFFAFEAAHLVEGENIDTFDVSQTSRESSDALDLSHVIGPTRDQDEANPNGPVLCSETAGEFVDRLVIHACKALVNIGSHGLQIKQHEIYGREIGIAQPVSKVAVGIKRGVDAHFFGGGEDVEHETM